MNWGEKYVSYCDCGNYANGIGNEGAGDCMPCFFYTDGAEVNCYYLEGCVGRTLEHAAESTGKTVGA